MVKKSLKKEGNSMAKIGIIGGSGLYNIEGISDIKEMNIKTPFGSPSDSILLGTLEGCRIAFLPRHARGHKILPSEINSRANIYALKSLGVEQLLGISACGSLKEELKPRDFVLPDQLFDRTKLRISTFFGNGIVGHIPFDHPYCNELQGVIYDCAKELGITIHKGGTYVCIEGPQFSTKAESQVNRTLGFSIVGMTALPEAKLAREAEMCYSTVALVTDYDVWKEGEEVTAGAVIDNLNANVNNSKKLLRAIIPRIAAAPRKCSCARALQTAIFTRKDKMNKATLKKLDLLIGKYVK